MEPLRQSLLHRETSYLKIWEGEETSQNAVIKLYSLLVLLLIVIYLLAQD